MFCYCFASIAPKPLWLVSGKLKLEYKEFYQQTTQTKCFMWLEKNKIRVKECTKSMTTDNKVIKSDKFPFK